MQKYGQMANNAVQDAFACEVCGSYPARFNWSDLHGEGMCNQCGTPYQLLHYEGDGAEQRRVEKPPTINIQADWIPILKQYWNETHAYTGLGQIMLMRDYPECERGLKAFYAWCDTHKDILPKKEAA